MARMKHKAVEGEITVPESAIGTHVAGGWEVIEEGIDPDELQPVDPPAVTQDMWMHHPETGGEFVSPASAVPHWERTGWKRGKKADAAVEGLGEPTPPAEPAPEPEKSPARAGRRQSTSEGKENT